VKGLNTARACSRVAHLKDDRLVRELGILLVAKRKITGRQEIRVYILLAHQAIQRVMPLTYNFAILSPTHSETRSGDYVVAIREACARKDSVV